MPRINNIKIRRGGEQDWLTSNPILDEGEFGFDLTNNLIKIGNGQDTWINLSVLALANPIILSENSAFTNKMTIRSPIVDFKTVSDTVVFEVPEGYMFSIDSLEVLTTGIANPDSPPEVRFGNTSDFSAYHPPDVTTSNDLGSRHIIDNPQDAASGGTAITFGVTSESSAESHFGCGIISGHLIRLF
jgi:hypothetical protein